MAAPPSASSERQHTLGGFKAAAGPRGEAQPQHAGKHKTAASPNRSQQHPLSWRARSNTSSARRVRHARTETSCRRWQYQHLLSGATDCQRCSRQRTACGVQELFHAGNTPIGTSERLQSGQLGRRCGSCERIEANFVVN